MKNRAFTLIELLVVIADILFCYSDRLKEAEEGLNRFAANLGIEVAVERRFFESDSAACIENIKRRNRPERVEKELAFIEKIGDRYRLPDGATVLPIYRPKKEGVQVASSSEMS